MRSSSTTTSSPVSPFPVDPRNHRSFRHDRGKPHAGGSRDAGALHHAPRTHQAGDPRCVFVSAEATCRAFADNWNRPLTKACGVIVMQRIGDQWECPTPLATLGRGACSTRQPREPGHPRGRDARDRLRARRFQLSRHARCRSASPKVHQPDEELDNWAVRRRRQMMATNDPQVSWSATVHRTASAPSRQHEPGRARARAHEPRSQ